MTTLRIIAVLFWLAVAAICGVAAFSNPWHMLIVAAALYNVGLLMCGVEKKKSK